MARGLPRPVPPCLNAGRDLSSVGHLLHPPVSLTAADGQTGFMEATTGDSPPPTHRPPTPARPPCFDIYVFLSGLASLALPGTVGPTQSSISAATSPPRSCRPASPEDKPGLPSQTWPRWRREVLAKLHVRSQRTTSPPKEEGRYSE
ncbi:uncharacterized protein LOC131831678 isoform X2 [Mustela lutreola]|uniref:uncharacterized protein LOC131831678 isoform X2 n=1 Tax=Mustela lutreola TaxID=9666 RepID=UPI00279780C3|nr:uncharacterized protein LOC131831678 isoform X2 [Mustela lutreola]